MNTFLSRSRPATKLAIDWLTPLRNLDEQIFFPMRRKNLTTLLAPYLRRGESLLDVGSSCGRLARCLMDVVPCQIQGIDIHLQPQSYIPVSLYNGSHIPFPDGAFDGVMMVDMLHHTSHPEQVLKEAARVARKYILIKDHYWDNNLDVINLRWADYIGNAPYGVHLPYHYLHADEWKGMLERFGLCITHTSQFRYHPMDPCKHLIIKAEKI